MWVKDMQHDVEMTWDQIYEKIDELLGDDVPRQQVHKFPWARAEYKKKTVEFLPNGARVIKMNWNWAE
jgi:hypothetical protein